MSAAIFTFSKANIAVNPGEIRFLNRIERQKHPRARLTTLLGSCIAITVWHPLMHIGGMSHCLLPNRNGLHDSLDPRYIDEAILWFLRAITRINTQPKEYQVKLIGGGVQLPSVENGTGDSIGSRNVKEAEHLLHHYGFHVLARHVEGMGHRRVVFDLDSGDVWVQHQKIQQMPPGEPAFLQSQG